MAKEASLPRRLRRAGRKGPSVAEKGSRDSNSERAQRGTAAMQEPWTGPTPEEKKKLDVVLLPLPYVFKILL